MLVPSQAIGRRRPALVAAGLAPALLIAGAATGCSRVVDAVQREDCTARTNDSDCTPWPTTGHGANSDPWIVSHHDLITQMQPRVLVLNFDNGATVDKVRQIADAQVRAIAEGSRYHGYSDTQAPIFLAYQIAKVVDLADRPVRPGWPFQSSSQLPVTPTGSFDPLALFLPRFSDLYAFPDPAAPARNLSLCELFEQGVINEVWIQEHETGNRRSPLNVERKQTYDPQNNAVPGSFNSCVGGGGCLRDVNCSVTVRMAHLDRDRGPGCDLYVRGWGIEEMWDALPAFAAEAKTFLNRDFRTRFGVAFNGWENICDQTDLCVSYPTPTSATGTYANGAVWTIDPFIQGCGNTVFPPNAHQRYDFEVATPVQSRCERFGLGQTGGGGGDELEPYTAAKVAADEQAFPDCGGGWQIYWRQSIPGLNNQAKTRDGRPLRNWWPLLFY